MSSEDCAETKALAVEDQDKRSLGKKFYKGLLWEGPSKQGSMREDLELGLLFADMQPLDASLPHCPQELTFESTILKT